MGPQGVTRVDQPIAEFAARHEGVVAHRQLRALGYPEGAIRTRRERGALIPVRRGVYAVGHLPKGRRPRWMAALLATGDDSLLCGDSAAQLHGLRPGGLFPIEVLTTGRHRDQERLRVHRTSTIHPGDRITDGALRATSIPLTLIDIAARHGDAGLLAAVERMPSLYVETMRRTLSRHAGRRGAKRTRRLLAAYEDHTRSFLERAFLKLCRTHHIPRPQVNRHIAGAERDFSWPERRLVVEADGRAFHGTAALHAKDDRRDVELGIAGWRVHRFSYERIVLDPAGTAADLTALLAY